ncbi:uncharacterized protein LY89DRAFT_776425 [Mollisia scopiformis]|uniref:2EXR domain-containing protein n=1 Tax=Mollisia scopiformis TaxID=149040 RepID=A0A194XW92_MOLSC|nr:uncharacterized protein LY89DRAFT_776425 [Mollisia scopiformis]KUJ24284.1 hypothetical protein LY89DRAFT_776425 [Mollisia scopiformis]
MDSAPSPSSPPSPPSPTPSLTFDKFPDLPTELRRVIWKLALPGPRIVHLKQKLLKQPEGRWWERVRSDVAMWECDKPFEENEPDSDKEVAAEDEGTDSDSQQSSDFGVRMYRPDSLWGYSTETEIPAMLLACRESRDIALGFYQPLFASLGAKAQVYFDPHRDTLFIDHETFLCEDDEMAGCLTEDILPSDLAEVRELAIEGLGPYLDEGVTFEVWLINVVDISDLFPNVSKVTEICAHFTYGLQTHIGQKYVDLKKAEFGQDEEDIYVKDRSGDHPPYGTFYMRNLRIDRSFIDWDNFIDRQVPSVRLEDDLFEELSEWREQNKGFKAFNIKLDVRGLIPAADERLLLHDAALFEKEHNKGEWLSYRDWELDIQSKEVPAHFFT